jgi:hypothetical protein
MLSVGANNDTAARAVRGDRDNGYPRDLATLNIGGVTVYEGWTTDGTSHFLIWSEGTTEVSLDTASSTRASVDSAALKRQGQAVAAGLVGHLRN